MRNKTKRADHTFHRKLTYLRSPAGAAWSRAWALTMALSAALTLTMLVAPAAQAFTGCSVHNYITNGNFYVSAELGYGAGKYGMLRARASQPGPWENYKLCYNFDSDGSKVWSIMSEANGRWVSAEVSYTGSYTGMLRARATSVGPWEKFKIFRINGMGAYYFKSTANNRYVSAEYGYTGVDHAMLRARATTVGTWEHFGFLCSSGVLGSCP